MAEVRIIGLSNAQAKALSNNIDEIFLNDVFISEELDTVDISNETVKSDEESDDIYTLHCVPEIEIEEEEEDSDNNGVEDNS